MAGYEDVNDAERLSQDPTFRLIGSEKIWERGAALTSACSRSKTELLTQEKNLSGPAAINRENYWLLLAEGHLNRRLFGSMVQRIGALPLPAG